MIKYNVLSTGSKGNADNEIWKDVKGFEGFYQISNYGRLKSYKQYSNGKIMSVTNKNGWYLTIRLFANGTAATKRIHRLVAEAFIPNLDRLPVVNHKDGNRQNNRADNLEWCTASYNVKHSMKMNPEQCKPMINYNKHVRPRRVLMMDMRGSILRVFPNCAEAGRITGVCARVIHGVCRHEDNGHGYKRKSAGGYIWQYESEVMM